MGNVAITYNSCIALPEMYVSMRVFVKGVFFARFFAVIVVVTFAGDGVGVAISTACSSSSSSSTFGSRCF